MSRLSNRSVDAGYFDIKRGDKPSSFLRNEGDIDLYYNHIREVEKIFDEALRPLGIRFSAKDILRRSEGGLRGDQWIARFILGETKGRVWPNQILTTIDILRGILENPGKSGICVGATMCGKTGSSNNCNWLPLFLQLLTGQPYILITLIPRSKALADQTSTERASFLSFYGDAELHYGNQVVSLKRYFTQDLYHKFPPSLFNPSDQEANSSKSKANVIRRVTGKMIDRLDQICRIADDLGIKIIFVVDESHYGAGTASVQDLMLNSKSAEVISGHHGHIMVGFSATPWEHMNLNNIWEVRHRLGYKGVTTYVGFNYLNGSPIDPTVNVQEPNVMSLAKYGEWCGGGELSKVVPGWYKSSDSYKKAVKAQRKSYDKVLKGGPDTFFEREDILGELPEDWEDYKELCHDEIASLLNFSLVEGKPFGGRGAVLRFVNDNRVMEEGSEFDVGLKRYLDPSIRLLYYMQGKNEEAVERAINSEIPKNQPYVVIVTGSGRMGDLFPPEVKYGFEFARDIQLTPLQQGIVGRITGHNKGFVENGGGFINNLPVVALSPRPKQVMDEFIRSKGMAVRRPNNRVINGIRADDGASYETRGAGEHNITLFASDMAKDPFLKTVHDRINEEIVSGLKRNVKMPLLNKPFMKLDNNARTRNLVPIWEILTEDVLKYVEANYEEVAGEIITKRKIVLLRPSFNGNPNYDDTGYQYACLLGDGKKLGRVGFRNARLASNLVGGTGSLNKAGLVLPNDTLPASGNKAGINGVGKQIDLQIHVLNTRAGWKMAALRLRCVGSFKSRVIGGTLPTDRSYTKGFMTDAEITALKKRIGK